VILPDINLLIHAYNSPSPAHPAAREWWERCLAEDRPVLLAWVVVLGFLRLSTHPQIATHPLSVSEATAIIRSWLRRPQVVLAHPGEQHSEILFGLLEGIGKGGNWTTDAHLAALALEHRAELHTTDSDFARFPGLAWRNPIAA
jgi:toxin-antitoxin system PIN domain toxin